MLRPLAPYTQSIQQEPMRTALYKTISMRKKLLESVPMTQRLQLDQKLTVPYRIASVLKKLLGSMPTAR